MTNLLIKDTEALFYAKNQIGGKACHLAQLGAYFTNIPPWQVLTTEAFQHFEQNSSTHLLSMPVKKLLASTLSPTQLYAVRSSVADEDGSEHSFAGMMDSFLFQQGIESIEQSIYRCYKSAFSPRALSYRQRKGLSKQSIKVAVIIQEMIEPIVSGVLFSANPNNGRRDECLISCTYGLGEGVVGGECETDEFTVNLITGAIQRQVRTKDFQMIRGEQGTKKVTVHPEQATSRTLNDQQCLQLKEFALKISQMQGYPQDIEWALDAKGKIHILQTRNITALKALPPENSPPLVFDNSNIQESFCGLTTPLTFSYASEAYFRVYHQMLTVIGLKESEMHRHEKRHRNMLALIKGRIYYNINSWYAGLLLLPFAKRNKQDMERMMGLQNPVDFIVDKKLSWPERLYELPLLIRSLWNLIKCFAQIDRLVSRFTRHFEQEYQKFNRTQLQYMDAEELLTLLDTIKERITSHWQAPIINDFYCMMTNGKIFRWMKRYKIANDSATVGNLLTGEEEIASTEPVKSLLKLADSLRSSPAALSLFQRCVNNQVMPVMAKHYPEFFQQCQQHIESYGDRCMGELKLESISLRQDPSFMFACLRNFLQQKDMTFQSFLARERALRQESEAQVLATIRKQGGWWNCHRFQRDLKKATTSCQIQRTYAYAENQNIWSFSRYLPRNWTTPKRT